jgi:hypothetical protein
MTAWHKRIAVSAVKTVGVTVFKIPVQIISDHKTSVFGNGSTGRQL